MNFWKTLLGFKRTELQFVLFAAFFALCVLPSGTPGAPFAPQGASAVLLLLSGDSALIESPAASAQNAAPPAPHAKQSPPSSRPVRVQTPTICVLDAHVAAFLTGIRTNRRLI